MLTIGTKAPDITVMDHTGKPFSLSDAWHHHSVVLFFYPKADTPICTKEACAFRDALADLEARDAMVIGVSTDDVAVNVRSVSATSFLSSFCAIPKESSATPTRCAASSDCWVAASPM
jgi:peroxiredoxin